MALLEEPVKQVRLIKNFINGEWVESGGEVEDGVNPATYGPRDASEDHVLRILSGVSDRIGGEWAARLSENSAVLLSGNFVGCDFRHVRLLSKT